MSSKLYDEFYRGLLNLERERVAEALVKDTSLANQTVNGLHALLFVQRSTSVPQIYGDEVQQIIELLLTYGADINARNNRGETLLHTIIRDIGYPPENRTQQRQMVQMLLDRGADLSIKDNWGRTPFDLACETHTATSLVPLLLLHEARFPHVKVYHSTDIVPREFLYAFAAGDRAKLVSFLERDRSLANAYLCDKPILEFAFKCMNWEIMEVLLNHGADPNSSDGRGDGKTILENFFYYDRYLNNADRVPLVRLLLDRGAILHDQFEDECGNPLHRAVKFNEVGLVQLLIDRKVDVNAVDGYDRTPLYLASKNLEITRVLLDNGADVKTVHHPETNPLHATSRVEIVQLLLERGADVDSLDKDDKTLLEKAVEEKKCPLVKLLLRHQADVNVTIGYGDSLLHRAVVRFELAILQLLLDHHADLNAENDDSETPLHVACFYCNVVAIDVLLRHGAQVCARNKYNSTPLHNAFASKASGSAKLKAVTLLVECGADMTIENVGSMTPLSFAREQGDLDVIYALIRECPHHQRARLEDLCGDQVPMNAESFFLFAECRNTKKILSSLPSYARCIL